MIPDSEWRQGEGIVELANRLLRERDEARGALRRISAQSPYEWATEALRIAREALGETGEER